MLEEAGHAVVIAFGEGDGDGDSIKPFAEYIEHVWAHTLLCVDEVTRDDETGRVCFLDQAGEVF